MVILNVNHGPWLGGIFSARRGKPWHCSYKRLALSFSNIRPSTSSGGLATTARETVRGAMLKRELRAKFDFELAEACLEEVAFDQGKDPDVECVKGMDMQFQDWFDLQTFSKSGIMARGSVNAHVTTLSRCLALAPRTAFSRVCFGASCQVALRRWFSWTYAYERFDEQWTAARVVTRWLAECLGTWVEQEQARH